MKKIFRGACGTAAVPQAYSGLTKSHETFDVPPGFYGGTAVTAKIALCSERTNEGKPCQNEAIIRTGRCEAHYLIRKRRSNDSATGGNRSQKAS